MVGFCFSPGSGLTVTNQVILGLSQSGLARDCLVQIYTFNLHQIVNYRVGWGERQGEGGGGGNFHHQKYLPIGFYISQKNKKFLFLLNQGKQRIIYLFLKLHLINKFNSPSNWFYVKFIWNDSSQVFNLQ